MSVEIERKFRVAHDGWRNQAEGTLYRQGFLSTHKDRVVRIRVVGNQGTLTIKGRSQGAVRPEFEYTIPVEEANNMLENLCEHPLIEKWRYKIHIGEHMWEVDEFLGDNAGLILAEVELDAPDTPVEIPDWVGREVTEDGRYANASLVSNPYSSWQQEA
uniref:Putative Adenylate cyclase n=1 Tax=Magnetococcus massalia (strain MO-1) TaxID=451514 RepID=A0A1S7LJ88_MAGMO|nr:putative Adenylate cyclase [Candidatus Magnetococcus massalia]